MGFPLHYTAPCLPKGKQQGPGYLDVRHSLIGNSWHVVVVTSLLRFLFHPLGLSPVRTVQEILDAAKPGGATRLATFLQRLPLRQERRAVPNASEAELAKKLTGLVSIKGRTCYCKPPQRTRYGSTGCGRLSLPSCGGGGRSVAGVGNFQVFISTL